MEDFLYPTEGERKDLVLSDSQMVLHDIPVPPESGLLLHFSPAQSSPEGQWGREILPAVEP